MSSTKYPKLRTAAEDCERWRDINRTAQLLNHIMHTLNMAIQQQVPVVVHTTELYTQHNYKYKQEAELSQRKRAAVWVSFGAATGGSLYAHNLRLKGRPPPTICARLDRPVNALPLKVFRQRNFVADFRRKKVDFYTRIGLFAFSTHPFWDPLLGGLKRQCTMFILETLESA